MNNVDFLIDLLARELSEGKANPVTGELEFATTLWNMILPKLEDEPDDRDPTA